MARSVRTSTRQPRRVVTGRALVLGAVSVLLLVLLASPIHRYFASRSAANAAANQLDRDTQALQAARQQTAKWSDPSYLQQQARVRLQYAMPGDTVYTVLRPNTAHGIDPEAGRHGDAARTGSWNTRMWQSVQAAGAAK